MNYCSPEKSTFQITSPTEHRSSDFHNKISKTSAFYWIKLLLKIILYENRDGFCTYRANLSVENSHTLKLFWKFSTWFFLIVKCRKIIFKVLNTYSLILGWLMFNSAMLFCGIWQNFKKMSDKMSNNLIFHLENSVIAQYTSKCKSSTSVVMT